MIPKHVLIDPEQTEPNTFLQLSGPLANKRILEIGCGDGRLTWRYADTAGQIIGIDPNADRIETAQQNVPHSLAHKVSFHTADTLTFHDPEPFDLALLSWSL